MPLSSLRGTLFTRASQFAGESSSTLDIDGLSDIGEAIADADLFIIDNGGGGTNAKTAVTRIPTYIFSKVTGDITVASDGTASIGNNSVDLSTHTTGNYIATIAGTTDEITVSGSGSEGATVTIGLPDDVTISGDLTVSGTTTTVNSTTVTVNDPLFALANNNSSDAVDIGWYGKYVDSGTKYSGLFRDASDSDMWKLFAATGNSNAAPSTTVDTSSGFALANLSVNELTGTIATAAQGNITSLGTLSALTVDDVAIDGKVVTMTGSSGDTATITVGTNGTLDITTTDTAAAAANIQITADGTAELAGTTVTLDSEGGITLDANGGTITFADDGVSLGTITSSGYSGTAAVASVATTVTITDNESTNEDNAVVFTAGGDVDGGNLGLESDGNLTYNPSTGTLTSTSFSGNLTGTASIATTVTITDNESTDEDNAVVFTAGGDVDGGNLGLESDGNLTYNPSTGTLSATSLAGTITTASQTNITAVGTIGTGTWQGTAIADTYLATITTADKVAGGAIQIDSGTDGTSISVAGTDKLLLDDGGTTKYINVSQISDFLAAGDITAVTAGDGLSGGGTSGGVTLALDLNELSAATVAQASDSIVIIDADDSNASRKESVADFVSAIAGTGLSASSGQLNASAGAVTALNNATANELVTVGSTTTELDSETALTFDGTDLKLYKDANDADVSFSLGTSATEALTIQVLNGGSNKTAEEVHFSTATASSSANDGKMVFDVDGTDIATIDDGGIDLASGMAFSINGSDIATSDTTYSAGTLLDLSSTTFNVDLTEAGEAAIANGDYILFLDGGATGSHAKENIADVATLFAGTGLTATNSVIAVDSSQAITALTGGDLTIYDDSNNADVSFKMGTSATEALSIEVLNGSSNKTAESVTFSTATASGTSDHGKFTFNVDGTDIFDIDDSGINLASGKTFRINGTTIDGDITGVTAGNGLSGGGTDGAITLALDLSELTDTAIANGDYIVFTDTTDSNATVKGDLADVATLFAGTGLTASSSVIGVDASQAITALTGGDLTIYEDANNADVSLKLGTSATESLSIEVLNGSSNKTAEEIHFSTATASSTANHGKMVFDIDGTDQMEINDSGVSITGDLTITGDDLFMNTNTAGHILVGDDTNYNPVAVSGDVTLSSSGAVTIANDAVESGMLNDNVISGQTEISSGLADADELLYSDAGTLKKVGLDTLTTHINSAAASKGFATAMAIAL